ncbi:MAG TPA: ROK family glucokinase [Nocardioidaceae bacterium]|nr:ROK family glucokinase [Nocardioidaceae bacterium]
MANRPKPREVLTTRLQPRSGLTIGVDIGGTKVLAGVVDGDGRVLETVRRQTPDRSKRPDVVEATIVEVVHELSARHRVAAVGVGAAGFVDSSRSTVLFSPHLSWRNEPLKAALHHHIRLPVVIDNDANMTAWAEYRFGAARGYRHALCVTMGTGIGGALLVDGRIFRGGNGMAGEFGHMQVVPQGRRCECGNRGCWEQYCSGNALVREARELLAAQSPVAHQLRALTDDDASRLSGPIVTAAASAGDPAAIELFEEIGAWLGTGLANLCAAFDPDRIIVGGGVSEAGDLLLDPAREALRRSLTGRGFRPEPPVVRAHLGADAGFVGAADMARSALGRSRRSSRRRSRRRDQ